jgi:allophanate hydrolase
VSVRGVVPACRSFDCVSVFASTVPDEASVLGTLAVEDQSDPTSRTFPTDTSLAVSPHPIIASPDPEELDDLDDARRALFGSVLARLESAGVTTVRIDLSPFLQAGGLLYSGAFVAERYAAVGAWIDSHRDLVDPSVGSIISAAGRLEASRLARDIEMLAVLRRSAERSLRELGAAALVLPTAPFHPTIREVQADPVELNARLGRYTSFVNLLDMCAVAVPVGTAGFLPNGVSVIGPAFSDLVQLGLAQIIELTGSTAAGESTAPGSAPLIGAPEPPSIPLVVIGAHLSGQPLNHQLTERGARFVRRTRTASQYQLYALSTRPPRPGLVRVARGGASLEAEVWVLPPVGFASLVAAVPPPLAIGTVVLADRSSVPGFVCEPAGLDGATDITSYGGWLNYLSVGG